MAKDICNECGSELSEDCSCPNCGFAPNKEEDLENEEEEVV